MPKTSQPGIRRARILTQFCLTPEPELSSLGAQSEIPRRERRKWEGGRNSSNGHGVLKRALYGGAEQRRKGSRASSKEPTVLLSS